MNTTIETARRLMAVQEQSKIKERISAMQAFDPSLSFQAAWDRLQTNEPVLFRSDLVQGVESGKLAAVAAAGFPPALPGNGVGTPVDDLEAVRQRKIQALVEEISKITFKTAYLMIRHQNPELFPEMENLDVKEKNMARQEQIKAAVEKLRLRKSHLNFAAAWHALQSEKPELFDFESA